VASQEEKEFLDSIQQNPQQFGKVYDLYYKKIFGYAFRRTGNYHTARDVCAETFLKAFLHIKDFKWQNIPISAWLYKIATNEINQYFRRKKYEPEALKRIQNFNWEKATTIDEGKNIIESQLKANDDFLQVQKHLKTLDIKYQEVIALRFFEDKTIPEISVVLDKPEGTIKSLLSRGLEKLRTMMEN
jgi:RNA polymerase sigma-70 factor, ECF subfamily